MNEPDGNTYQLTSDSHGARHRDITGNEPSLSCWKCNQQAFILHYAAAPAPTLLECSCCGERMNIGLLYYMYFDRVHPDALLERERCAGIVEGWDGDPTGEHREIAKKIRSGK